MHTCQFQRLDGIAAVDVADRSTDEHDGTLRPAAADDSGAGGAGGEDEGGPLLSLLKITAREARRHGVVPEADDGATKRAYSKLEKLVRSASLPSSMQSMHAHIHMCARAARALIRARTFTGTGTFHIPYETCTCTCTCT